jgi:hypothetical protein
MGRAAVRLRVGKAALEEGCCFKEVQGFLFLGA